MRFKDKDLWLGLGTMAFGAMLLVYAIPHFIFAPSNVRALVLSPSFWPTIVAYIIILLGAALTISRIARLLEFGPASATTETGSESTPRYAWARLAASAALMVGLVMAIPTLGMVLASCIVYALFAVIIATPRPITSLIVAIVLPFVLYAFFAHIAGVSIPQGRLLSLP